MRSFRSNPRSGLAGLPGNCPATWALIFANAATFVAAFVGLGGWTQSLVFQTSAFFEMPWTAVTYPLVGAGNPVWLLLSAYILWLFGGSLERGWGWREYLIFLGLTSAATAVALWIGTLLVGGSVWLAGLGMPLAAIVIAWASLNPDERVLLYFVLPIQARWLAIGTAVLVVFSLRFPLGVFALAGLGVAWWFAGGGKNMFRQIGTSISSASAGRRTPQPTLNPLILYRRWRTKRRFMRLMRNTDSDEHIH